MPAVLDKNIRNSKPFGIGRIFLGRFAHYALLQLNKSGVPVRLPSQEQCFTSLTPIIPTDCPIWKTKVWLSKPIKKEEDGLGKRTKSQEASN